MHPCLCITEILRIIARGLRRSGKYPREQELLSMALTCRAFFDIAADVLWEKINRPKVLFLCLPAHVRGKGEYLYTIVEPPTQADWQRFELYARRVKVLDQTFEIYGSDEEVVSCHAINPWKSLRKYYPRTTPFPNLRSFRCNLDKAVRELYEFIVPSTLQSIIIDCEDSKTLKRACKATRVCKESLQALEIVMIYCSPRNLKRIAQTTKSLPFLQRLRISELLPECLADISSIPRLETLSAYLDIARPYSRGAVGNYEFNALKDLKLSLPPEEAGLLSLLSFFGVCNFRNLTILTINCTGFLEFELKEAQDLTMKLLEAVSNLEQIHAFRWQSCDSYYYPSPRGHTFDFTVLTSILSIRSLVELEIYHTAFSLSSEDVHTIARAWPKLRRLILGVSHHSTPSSYKPTLVPQDLQPFAVHCPDLEALGLPLKFPSLSRPPSDPEPPIPRVTNPRLRTLDCGDYPVTYSLGVAKFLASVFPNVTLLKRDEESEGDEAPFVFMGPDITNHEGIDEINAKVASIVKQAREL